MLGMGEVLNGSGRPSCSSSSHASTRRAPGAELASSAIERPGPSLQIERSPTPSCRAPIATGTPMS